MNNSMLKKVFVVLSLCLAIGVSACSAGGDIQGEEDGTEFVDNGNGGSDNGVVEIHNEASGGHFVSDGSFTSVSFDDGTSFSF